MCIEWRADNRRYSCSVGRLGGRSQTIGSRYLNYCEYMRNMLVMIIINGRCETMSAFVVQFGIDRQREPWPTLLRVWEKLSVAFTLRLIGVSLNGSR